MYAVQSDKHAPMYINMKKVKQLFLYIGMKMTFN